MVEKAEVGAPISLDGVAVHSDCWCVSMCYLHFAPENAEDGKMYLLVRADPGCPGQSPESRKMVLCMCMLACKPSGLVSQLFKQCTFVEICYVLVSYFNITYTVLHVLAISDYMYMGLCKHKMLPWSHTSFCNIYFYICINLILTDNYDFIF